MSGWRLRSGSVWRWSPRSFRVWVAISVALIEIVVGAVAGNIVGLPLVQR